MDLTGQVILITGGSRGLGRAFAQALLAAGARVAIIDILAVELNETAAQLSSAANQVVAIRADVTDPQAAPQVVTTVEERLGPITLLINNAGQFRAFGLIGVVDPIAWWNEVEVNLRGPFLYTNAVLPGMRRRHRGRIINLASRAGIQGIPTLSAYVTSKAALIRFSEALALETIEDGIQVFAIHPGTLRTPMNDYVHDSPEVAKSAPWVQQRFRTVYAQGLDTPIERPVHLMLRLAAGDADALSGRYISVEDDLDALLKECSADPSADQPEVLERLNNGRLRYQLRLKTIHTKQVRWCHEQLPYPIEPGFEAERMPSGNRLREIGQMDMSRYCVPFLQCQCGPRRLLAVPATKPSIAVLAVWACVFIDQKETVTANYTAYLAHQVQFR